MDERTSPIDALRTGSVQAIAMLMRRVYEDIAVPKFLDNEAVGLLTDPQRH